MAQHLRKRSKQDHDVESQVPVADVPKVHIESLLHQRDLCGIAAAAMNLGPAGDAGLDVMTLGVVRQYLAVLIIMSDGMRPRAR